MTPQEILRQQQETSPKEDLSAYDGQWVVLRNGYVVANGDDPVQLRQRQDVRPDDAIIPVAIAASHILV
jgi:hypothetical protein